jgi:hypothetical protein
VSFVIFVIFGEKKEKKKKVKFVDLDIILDSGWIQNVYSQVYLEYRLNRVNASCLIMDRQVDFEQKTKQKGQTIVIQIETISNGGDNYLANLRLRCHFGMSPFNRIVREGNFKFITMEPD